MLTKLEKALKVQRKFAVQAMSSSDGSVDRMMEIVRSLEAVLQEERRDLRE